MENWEKRYDEMIEKFEGKTVRVTKENGLVKQFISSELESAKQEERERIVFELKKSWKESVALFPYDDFAQSNYEKLKTTNQSLAKLINSLHQNNNKQGGK